MFNYTLKELTKLTKEVQFNRDTLEKVLRLASILRFLNEDSRVKGKFVLKGGTAINLIIFDLPRLSVDIDLDYAINCSKDEMILDREYVNTPPLN